MNSVRHRSILAAICALAALFPATALASGSVRVQQVDGRVEHYANVGLQLRGNSLTIISPDRVGKLIVGRAACTWIGGLQRCLPSELVLSQHGTHHIQFQRGTLYLNLSDDPHTLPHSSRVVPPHSVLALLKTMHGTFIAVNGRLDEVNP